MSRIPYDSCPLCGGESERLLTANCSDRPLYSPSLGEEMVWVKCKSCGHVHTDGYFPSDSTMFSRIQEEQRVGNEFWKERKIWARVIERVHRYAKPGGWLDVGVGNASLLLMLDEWDYSPSGVDIRPFSVKELKELGVPAYGDMSEVPEKQSVISLCDVLEHVPYPKDMLKQVRETLVDDGVLLISCPNYDCRSWRTMDLRSPNIYWREIEHFHNFSKKRLYSLLDEFGFEPVDYNVSERYVLGMEVIARKHG